MKVTRIAGMLLLESDYPQMWCYLPIHEATDREIRRTVKAFKSCGVAINFGGLKSLIDSHR